MKRYSRIIKVFVQKSYYKYIILAFAMCLFSNCIFSYRNLNDIYVYKIIETYAILVGIVLFATVFEMEQDVEIWNLLRTKNVALYKVYLMRLAIAIIVLVLVMGCFVWKINDGYCGELDVKKIWMTGIYEATFLGSIALFFSAITNQMLAGLMMSVTYYLVNVWWSNKLGHLSLFHLIEGKDGFEMYMAVCTIALAIISVYVREKAYSLKFVR